MATDKIIDGGKAKRLSSQDAFLRSNPRFWEEIAGDAEKVERTRAITHRCDRTRNRLIAHHAKHRERWVDREYATLLDGDIGPKRAYQLKGMGLTLNDFREEAEFRVELRGQARQRLMNKIEDRLLSKNVLERDLAQKPKHQVRERAHPLKADVHRTVNRAQALRKRAREHFNKHKDGWIAKAQEEGGERAISGVFRRQAMRMQTIDRAEHRVLHATFKAHGVDRAPTPNRSPTNSGIQMQ